MQEITLQQVVASTSRLPYLQGDIDAVLLFLKKEKRNGLDVHYSKKMGTTEKDFAGTLREGVIVLACPQIGHEFAIVSENNGCGLLGGQKKRFRIFLSELDSDAFVPGPSFRGLLLALTSINNVFRGNGVLQGGAY